MDDHGSSLAESEEGEKGGRFRSVSLVLSITLLMVIAMLAVVSMVVLNRDDDSSSDTTPPAPVPAGPSETAPPVEIDLRDKFSTPTTDIRGQELAVPKNPWGQLLPQTGTSTKGDEAPAGLMWQQVFHLPLPFSTSDGPTTISSEGGVSGFSRTQAGAALAAWQLGWRLAAGPKATRDYLLEHSVHFDPQFAESQFAAYASLPALSAADLRMFNDIPQYVRVSSYSPDLATIQYGTDNLAGGDSPAGPGGGVISFTVVWQSGEWKLSLQGEDGAIAASVTEDPFSQSEGWNQW